TRKDPTAAPARWINRRCELRSHRACARGSINWFSQLLAPQRSTAFSESGGHSVSQIRLGRNNKCRGYERGTHFLKTEWRYRFSDSELSRACLVRTNRGRAQRQLPGGRVLS